MTKAQNAVATKITTQMVFPLGGKATGNGRSADFADKPSVKTAAPMVAHFANSLATLGGFKMADLLAAAAKVDLAALDVKAAPKTASAKVVLIALEDASDDHVTRAYTVLTGNEPKSVKAMRASLAKAGVSQIKSENGGKLVSPVLPDESAPITEVDAPDQAQELKELFPVNTAVNALWIEDGESCGFFIAKVISHTKSGNVKVMYEDGIKAERTVDELQTLKGKKLAAAQLALGLTEAEVSHEPKAPPAHGFRKNQPVTVSQGRGKKALQGKIVAVNDEEAIVLVDGTKAHFPVESLRAMALAAE